MYLPHSVRVPLLRFITFYCIIVFFAFLLMYFTLINLALMTTITILLLARMVYYLSYLLVHQRRILL